MIAKQDQHYSEDVLRDLLEDRLSEEEAERIQEHIAHCDACREALEALAGQDHWWNETVDVLSESQLGVTDTSARISIDEDNPDQTLDWVRPLLEECPETPNALGRLDGYVVQRVIGQGGMGVVLRGIDLELNRPVAIKILSPHLAGVGAARARFMREAQAAAAVVHPSIVPIYSVVTSTRLPYIVMPCIQGGNLQQRIDQEGPLEIDEVLRIGVQIAEGLAAAHQHGVIHRDIKPANILVEEGNGRVLISDFGLARALDDATLTISGMIAGTPQYMSPEQARGEPIDARSDLYSLGSLLYALSTGRPPFRADSALAVLRKICDTTPRPIHHVNERMPLWLDSLVSQLMQTQRDGRIATADRAAELLREAHAHVRNPSHNALPRGITTLRWKSFAPRLALVMLMFVVIGGFAVSQWSGTNPTQQDVQATGASSGSSAPNVAISTDWVDYQWAVEMSDVQNDLNSLQFQLEQEFIEFPDSSVVFPSIPPNLVPHTITDQ